MEHSPFSERDIRTPKLKEYDLNGKKIDYLPAAVEDQLKIKPVYKTFDGWKSSTNGIKNIKDLPENKSNASSMVISYISKFT